MDEYVQKTATLSILGPAQVQTKKGENECRSYSLELL